MAISAPGFISRHQLVGTSTYTHTTDLGVILGAFDTIHHVLWDDSGFITSDKVRSGIKRVEDATVRLDVLGQVGNSTGPGPFSSHDTWVARIEIVFSLPFGKYKRFEDIPSTVWGLMREELNTYLVISQSLTVLDGLLV